MLATFSTGCGKSKMAQCNEVLDQVNASTKAEKAAEITAVKSALDGMQLKDEKLAAFRKEYSTYLGKVANEYASLEKNGDESPTAHATYAKLATLGEESTKLLQGISPYCSAE